MGGVVVMKVMGGDGGCVCVCVCVCVRVRLRVCACVFVGLPGFEPRCTLRIEGRETHQPHILLGTDRQRQGPCVGLGV